MNISEFLKRASETLEGLTDTPRLDAELLLLEALKKERSYLYTWPELDISEDQLMNAQQLLQRRQNGEPVAYILGRRDFWDFRVEVSPATLIPRPETELLVELALQRFAPDSNLDIADLGTGSGILAIALAREFSKSKVSAVDLSEAALEVAKRNAEVLHVDNIDFFGGSWFASLHDKRFDLVISNPPYIEDEDHHLQQADVRFEPRSALASGADGLDDIRIIAVQVMDHLKPDGVLAVEHGFQQGAKVREIFSAAGFVQVETLQDLQGHDRVTVGSRIENRK